MDRLLSTEDILLKTDIASDQDGKQPLGSEPEGLFPAGEADKTVHWSIPWSDLMMTMFVLFATLYIFQSSISAVGSKQKVAPKTVEKRETRIRRHVPLPTPAARHAREDMSHVYELSNRTIQVHGLEDFASVDLIPNQAVRIVLASDVIFDSGRAALKHNARKRLEHVAEIIRQVPHMVNVVGHADDLPVHSGRFSNNWELSGMRACEVTRFLIEESGIPGERFYISAHAYHQPLVPNDSSENRAANRRVEIIMTPEKPNESMAFQREAPSLGVDELIQEVGFGYQ